MSDFLGPIGSVVGSVLGFMGTQSTNSSNQAINSANILAQEQANSQNIANSNMELDMSRQYDSQQTQNNQQFQQLTMGEAENYNTTMTQYAMDYNTMMSDTARQRGVADMKAAGLNPILAAASGGASTPTVNAATISPSSAQSFASPMASPSLSGGRANIAMENPMGGLISGAKQGADIAESLASIPLNLKNKDATNNQIQASADLANSNSKLADANTGLTTAKTLTEAKTQGLIDKQTYTEGMKPILMQAQTGQANSAAGLNSAQEAQTRLQTDRLGNSLPRDPSYLESLGVGLGQLFKHFSPASLGPGSSGQGVGGGTAPAEPDFSITNPGATPGFVPQ